MRLSARIVGLLLSIPLLSVSTMAWMSGNPFNGLVFAVVGVVLVTLSIAQLKGGTYVARDWRLGVGLLLFALGFFYPHFTHATSVLRYVYATPTGLIPCPTLLVVIGLSMILGSFKSRSWSLTLGSTGVLYGIYGATYLGVVLDWVLFFGGLLLIFISVGNWRAGNRYVQSV